MGISGRVPLEPVQEIARSLVEQLKADEYCPYELRVSQRIEGVKSDCSGVNSLLQVATFYLMLRDSVPPMHGQRLHE